MTNHGGVIARRLGQLAAVANLALHIANDGSLGHLSDGQRVADHQASLGAAVDELSRVQALRSDKELLVLAVLVLVAKLNAGQRRTAAGVVLNGLDNTLHESVALGKVVFAELMRRGEEKVRHVSDLEQYQSRNTCA